jgi:peptide-methionine (R)-S-oxide reductase
VIGATLRRTLSNRSWQTLLQRRFQGNNKWEGRHMPDRDLSPAQHAVLREHATERPFTSPLNDEKRSGEFFCAGCGSLLYVSDTKYNSGSGWPSFYDAVADAVATTTDSSLGMVRTEVHCAKCEGHLGHIFPDGPRPTGLRHCINGLALDFVPED